MASSMSKGFGWHHQTNGQPEYIRPHVLTNTLSSFLQTANSGPAIHETIRHRARKASLAFVGLVDVAEVESVNERTHSTLDVNGVRPN